MGVRWPLVLTGVSTLLVLSLGWRNRRVALLVVAVRRVDGAGARGWSGLALGTGSGGAAAGLGVGCGTARGLLVLGRGWRGGVRLGRATGLGWRRVAALGRMGLSGLGWWGRVCLWWRGGSGGAWTGGISG